MQSIEHMAPITLEEMNAVKLMNRTDSKYVTTEATLQRMLEAAAAAGYRVLESEGRRIGPYDTVYFDTQELTMFYLHHNRRLVRQKVRTRCYQASGDTFLEIKRKNNHGRTSKKRIGIQPFEMMEFSGNTDACAYLAKHSWFQAGDLRPVLETSFQRITLVNPSQTERITIDSHLEFKNFQTGHRTSLQDAVIIELKQDGRAASQMKGILLDLRIKPLRVSKYCIALTLTNPVAKTGRFKEKVRAIEKIIGNQLVTI